MFTKRMIIATFFAVSFWLGSSTSALGQRNLLDNILGEVVNQALQSQGRSDNQGGQPKYGGNSVPDESGQGPPSSGFRPSQGWENFRPNTTEYFPERGRRYNQPQPQTQPETRYRSGDEYRSEPPVLRETVVQQPIKISFRRTQSGTCDFTLISGSSEFARTLKPGQMQPLKGSSASWLVRYVGRGGQKTYRLRGGQNYEFRRDGEGFMQLYRLPPKPVVIEEPPLLTE